MCMLFMILSLFLVVTPSPEEYYIIDFGGQADLPYSGFENTGKRADIEGWARGQSLKILPDSEPVSDGIASFVSRYGAEFSISGLRQHVRYLIWLDPVRFRSLKGTELVSRLEISADGRKIADFTWKDVHGGSGDGAPAYIPVSIPTELTYDGKVHIRFKEYSERPGMWGFWDIVIAPEQVFPSGISVRKPLGEKAPELTDKKPVKPAKIKKITPMRKTAPAEAKPVIKPDTDKPAEAEKPSMRPQLGTELKKETSNDLQKDGIPAVRKPEDLEIRMQGGGEVTEPKLPREPDVPKVEVK